jgi:carbohydrate-selective porin OprB
MMEILTTIGQFLMNNALAGTVAGTVSAVAGVAIWKLANFVWDRSQKFQDDVVSWSCGWASRKGDAFGSYYKSKIKDVDLRRKTVDALAKSSDKIQEAFIAGVRRGAGL